MKTDTTEKRLESLITNYLCDTVTSNSFVLREHPQYNRTDCVDEGPYKSTLKVCGYEDKQIANKNGK